MSRDTEFRKSVVDFCGKNGYKVKSLLKTDKHISKRNGRQCHECLERIQNGEECFTESYKLKNTYVIFQASFHVKCYKKKK